MFILMSLGLFDGLLPAEFQEKLVYPDKPPILQVKSGNFLISAIFCKKKMEYLLHCTISIL
jgi:hypothetical protein